MGKCPEGTLKKQSGMKKAANHDWLNLSYIQIWLAKGHIIGRRLASEWNWMFMLQFCSANTSYLWIGSTNIPHPTPPPTTTTTWPPPTIPGESDSRPVRTCLTPPGLIKHCDSRRPQAFCSHTGVRGWRRELGELPWIQKHYDKLPPN